MQPQLDQRIAGDEVGVFGVADHEVSHDLGAQPDPVELVGGLDSAPLELALEDVGGDRPARDPHRGDCDEDQQQQRQADDRADASPAAAAAHDYGLGP